MNWKTFSRRAIEMRDKWADKAAVAILFILVFCLLGLGITFCVLASISPSVDSDGRLLLSFLSLASFALAIALLFAVAHFAKDD
jgi:hypothetical protein